MSFARGIHALGECMRCGFRVRYHDLIADGYEIGLRVCFACYDPAHPAESMLAIGADAQALAKPAPEVSTPTGEGTASTSITTILTDPAVP